MKILVHTYGHTRTADDAHVQRNSVILTNWTALQGCQKVGEVIDLTPLIPSTGIAWDKLGGAVLSRVEPADILYCQAGVSLEVMQKFKEVAPNGRIVLQRDSTHALHHLEMMRFGMQRHEIWWDHIYERNGCSLLNRELAEYALADCVFVLSKFVERTFSSRGIKTQCSAPQVAELNRWPFFPRASRTGAFTAVMVGQLGIRKGTLDLLEGWRRFISHFPAAMHPSLRLVVAGLPEHDAPEALTDRLDKAFASTPCVERRNWVGMDAMAALYSRAHVLVSASLEEGATMPGIEAALCGCALISTPESGIDILTPETGFGFLHSDPDSLVKALLEAFEIRTTQLSEMGKRACELARAQCGVDTVSDRIAQQIRTVAEA